MPVRLIFFMNKILPILLLLIGCQAHIGIAYHPVEADEPEVNIKNTLGVIRLTEDFGRTELFYEHISSLPKTEEGRGLNMIGVLWRVK